MESTVDTAPPASAGVLAAEDRQFVLDLVRDAATLGITEIEYKGLRVRISVQAARAAQQQSLPHNALARATWSQPIARAGET